MTNPYVQPNAMAFCPSYHQHSSGLLWLSEVVPSVKQEFPSLLKSNHFMSHACAKTCPSKIILSAAEIQKKLQGK